MSGFISYEAHPDSFPLQQFRFWSITQPIMLCHVSVHSGAFCALDTELGIRFQQPSLIQSLYFLILTIYLIYWTRFCSLQQQCLLYIGIKPKQHFKNAHCEFYEQFSCRKRMFPIQSLGVLCEVCRSHVGGYKLTKPIFSNSRKRYSGFLL